MRRKKLLEKSGRKKLVSVLRNAQTHSCTHSFFDLSLRGVSSIDLHFFTLTLLLFAPYSWGSAPPPPFAPSFPSSFLCNLHAALASAQTRAHASACGSASVAFPAV